MKVYCVLSYELVQEKLVEIAKLLVVYKISMGLADVYKQKQAKVKLN